MRYLVTPQDIKTGNKAAGIIVDASDTSNASAIAATQSSLSKSERWDFNRNVKKLKENQNTMANRKRKNEDE